MSNHCYPRAAPHDGAPRRAPTSPLLGTMSPIACASGQWGSDLQGAADGASGCFRFILIKSNQVGFPSQAVFLPTRQGAQTQSAEQPTQAIMRNANSNKSCSSGTQTPKPLRGGEALWKCCPALCSRHPKVSSGPIGVKAGET
ncbi:hypothetical protein KIL84_015720 [Mauremys mutica]|uniref:Uncharacterized protein n=1 Tax=Mauremys mutica TaxID=74926 RepID=A0A9D3WTV3_9SAUR|nr:hypothetical protein KIL84_015720 [Mauremys mutica]